MKITAEQIEFFREAMKTIRKGYYPSGEKAIQYYKEIFAEEIAKGTMQGNLSSKCGGCIRTSVIKVNEAIDKIDKMMKDETKRKAVEENKGT